MTARPSPAGRAGAVALLVAALLAVSAPVGTPPPSDVLVPAAIDAAPAEPVAAGGREDGGIVVSLAGAVAHARLADGSLLLASADHARVLQAALDRTAGTVHVRDGAYALGSGLRLSGSNVSLLMGPGAVLRAAAGLDEHLLTITGSDVHVQGGILDGRRSTNAQGDGIHVLAEAGALVQNVTLERVTVLRAAGDGIHVAAGAPGAKARFVRILESRVSDAGESGVFLENADESTVARNVVSRTGHHGILGTKGSSNRVTENDVSHAGAHYAGGFAHCIALDGNGVLNPNARHIVTDNHAHDCAFAGIEVADGVGDVVVCSNVVDATGTLASAANKYGIYFGGALAPGQGATICDNIVRNAGGNGIEVNGVGNATRTRDVLLLGNRAYGNAGNGIHVQWATNVTLADNVAYGNGRGGAPSKGLRVGDSAGVLVHGNRAFDDQAARTQDFGLGLDGWLEGVQIHGNALAGNAVADIGGAAADVADATRLRLDASQLLDLGRDGGPRDADQDAWLRVDVGGAVFYLPLWS